MVLIDELECTLCLVESRLRQLARSGLTEDKIKKFFKALAELDLSNRTVAFAKSYEIVLQLCNQDDIYSNHKSELRERFLNIVKPLLNLDIDISRAVKWAANANLLDVEMPHYRPDLSKVLETLDQEPHILSSRDPVSDMYRADHVLYVLDNVGEHLVDLVLVRALVNAGKDVTLLVRELPYEIDITYRELLQDLELLDLHNKVRVRVSSGRLPPILSIKEFDTNTLVISKGIANFEAYLNFYNELRQHKIMFMLTIKCKPLSKLFNVPLGKSIILSSDFLNKLLSETIKCKEQASR